MGIRLLLLFLLGACSVVHAQDQQLFNRIDANLKEGNALARIQSCYMAAGNIPEIRKLIYESSTVYFAYSDNHDIKFVVYRHSDAEKVLCTVTINESLDLSTIKIDRQSRPFTAGEKELKKMMKNALIFVSRDTAFFQRPPEGGLMYLPLISELGRRVYLVPFRAKSDLLCFGGDYSIEFDEENEVTGKTKLHSSLELRTYREFDKSLPDTTAGIHAHDHELLDGFTATDISQAMTYKLSLNWRFFFIYDRKFVYTLDMRGEKFLVTPVVEFLNRLGFPHGEQSTSWFAEIKRANAKSVTKSK